MSPQPFVSAVCVTGKSPYHVRHLLPAAIKCFHDQVYPADKRELLVVADGCLDELAEVVPEDMPGVRLILEDKCSLGALRNAGLRAAQRGLVLQWDDDDWHHPERMQVQVNAWMKQPEGLPVCLQRQLCYDLQRDVAFVRAFANTFIHGTILHETNCEDYPEQGREEDTVFVQQWNRVNVIDGPPELYVRLFHGDEHNTWDRRHVMREAADWRPGTWAISEHLVEFLQGVVAKYRKPGPRSDIPQRPVEVVQPPDEAAKSVDTRIPLLTLDGPVDRGKWW
jgi:glycosyltransferase involved in cell wall biosynthesis